MAGGEVATLINLDPLLAIGEVSERDLQYLKLGTEADIRLVSGMTVKGTLRYISRDASPSTRTFRIEVAIPNEDKTLPAGMTAEITLRSAPVDAVILPRSVVSLSAAGDLGIRSVDKDNKVAFHPIDLIDDTEHALGVGLVMIDEPGVEVRQRFPVEELDNRCRRNRVGCRLRVQRGGQRDRDAGRQQREM